MGFDNVNVGGDGLEFFQSGKNKGRRPRKKKINKKTKIHVVFDKEARKDFLLGFQKRKLERKEKHRERLQKALVQEKKRIREQAKENAKKMTKSNSIVPEVAHLIEDVEEEKNEDTYDVEGARVTVSSLDDAFSLRRKGLQSCSSENPVLSSKLLNPEFKKNYKKETNRLIQGSVIFKKNLKAKQKNNKRFRINRLKPKETNGNMGSSTHKVNQKAQHSEKSGKIKKRKK